LRLGFRFRFTHAADVADEISAQDATLTGPSIAGRGAGGPGGFAIRWVFPPTDGVATVLQAGSTVLGRDSECAGNLPSASVSRRHAEIRWTPGGVPMVRDIDSRNGVFLNGRAVSQAPMRLGDVLRLGDWIGIVVAVPSDGLPAWTFRQLAPGYWGGPLLQCRLEPARRGASSSLSIIVQGATGTGKEGAARSIHEWSGRTGPFVAVNCAALPESLAEAELFGYRKGAFTNADRPALGYLRSAHGGTLFLDEVSELSLTIQAKLLRALEQREVVPLGEATPIPVDIRVVTATQEPLRKAIDAKRFRSDFLARLEGLVLVLPSLRERAEEIPFLLSRLLETIAPTSAPARLDPLLVETLCVYKWPYNVRELTQFVRRVAALYPDLEVLDLRVLTESIAAARPLATSPAEASSEEVARALEDIGSSSRVADQPALRHEPSVSAPLTAAELEERDRIVRTLTQCTGNQTESAKRLGVSRSTLIDRIKRFKIPRPRAGW
jgi:DNA-binding NtrC family response regulator